MNIYRTATLSGLLLLAGGLMVGCGGGGDESPMASPEHQIVDRWQFEEGGRGGWTLESSDPDVGWGVDGFGDNAILIGGEWTWSGNEDTYSLNYNRLPNDRISEEVGLDNYDTPFERNWGSATSPRILLSGLEDPKLVFACTFDMQNRIDLDMRRVIIFDASTGLIHRDVQLGVGDVANSKEGCCSARKEWHSHTIDLDPEWGTVHVEFFFDTGNELKNDGKGWFLDDIQIQSLPYDRPENPGVIRLQAK